MRLDIIFTDFIANVKTWSRSKGTLFWTLAFPVILIVIFGAIFSGSDNLEYDLHVQDRDQSSTSALFNETLNNTGVLNIITLGAKENVTSYIEENNIKRVLVIPEGFHETIQQAIVDPSITTTLQYHFDPSETTTNQIIRNVLNNVIQSMNMNMSQGRNIISIQEISTITEDFGFIDFFLPGMIGFTIMQTCIYGSIERNTKFRKDGILRKLLTTPITRSEWIFSKMLFMLFLSFISTVLIVVVGMLLWGITVNITIPAVVIIVATSFLFSGMGMLIGRFVKEEETADTAGGAISFPMMFLAGTFFPLEQMPGFLQDFARVLPLYYVNEGLRNAMIYMNDSEALINMAAVLIFACVFFIAGLFTTKWSED